ncbi:MAG: outer membrane lipoprotein carrier protein LolA [Bacteroidia bacterium]|nr:outer membrane lipoprotein carrier protein LolA [Bacteroidia bacterium]MCZ2248010.1 outer membrane lipoprotein carrier protein LolA [Bacteroidia bacterium]
MKKALLSLMALIISFSVHAQNDARAKKVLDDLSAKTKTYSTINADFTITIENKKNKTTDTQSGKLALKGSKYKLEVNNQVIISDGKTSWTVLKDASEVQVNTVESKEKETGLNPSNIFTIYEKGFKYEFVKDEKQKNGETYQIVKLFPDEPKKKNFHTIVLTVSKEKMQIVNIKVLGKDGTDMTYAVKSFTVNNNFPDATFSFSEKNYPGYEVIDLR